MPAASATRITFSLSTMKTPFSGSSLLRSCASVRCAYTATSGTSRLSISITFMPAKIRKKSHTAHHTHQFPTQTPPHRPQIRPFLYCLHIVLILFLYPEYKNNMRTICKLYKNNIRYAESGTSYPPLGWGWKGDVEHGCGDMAQTEIKSYTIQMLKFYKLKHSYLHIQIYSYICIVNDLN